MNSGCPAQRSNLIAACLALVIASVGVAAGLMYCKRVEHRYVHALAPEFSDSKLQGIALQKQALAEPDLLMLYGSSELLQDIPTNATRFFEDYPTGFRVFPVGKPGTSSLAVLLRVAAMGEQISGRKVAYSMSPGFFFTESFDPKYYEGNFSELQAAELAFSNKLSAGLKRDVARRMLQYPRTLEGRWFLEWTLERLAEQSWIDRALYAAAYPLGRLHVSVGKMQDHFQVALNINEREEALNALPRRVRKGLNWSDTLRRAAQFVNATQLQAKKSKELMRRRVKGPRVKEFRETLARAQEWKDLEILLRTFQELNARPLLLAMPVEDVRMEIYGASPSERDVFLERLDKLTDSYPFPLLDFRDHSKDPLFLVDYADHLSEKGWLYYNHALDNFFHGRTSGL